MLSEHMILQTTASFGGKIHSAPFFVEGDVIMANIDGRTMRFRGSKVAPSFTVRTVLIGALANKERLAQRAYSNRRSLRHAERS
jgi:hypothetical protein